MKPIRGFRVVVRIYLFGVALVFGVYLFGPLVDRTTLGWVLLKRANLSKKEKHQVVQPLS